jgi:hypothetical protein
VLRAAEITEERAATAGTTQTKDTSR